MSPGYQKFEQTLAFHCAPSLAGIKPADLVSWCPTEPGAARLLGYYAAALTRRGIRLRVLGVSGGRLLLLIFRPKRLDPWLKQPAVRAMLDEAGYPQDADTDGLLRHLRGRLALSPDFPHEIGLFLGYPPEDVEGFRRYGGRGCKLTGCWKVYGDVEQAKKQFAAFDRCRAALTRRLQQGLRLEQVFPAA